MSTAAPAIGVDVEVDVAPAPSARRWRTPAAAAVAVLLVMGLVVVALFVVRPSSEPEGSGLSVARQRTQLTAYQEALRPLVQRGGHVVAVGIKPGMADVRDERYPPEVLTTMADGWIAELRSVRTDIDATKAPAFLEEAQWLYVRSLDGYVHAATTLRAAATADEAHEQELLDLASSLGKAADTLYDRADELVGRQQDRLDRSAKEK